jgi:hypothetical protein
VSVVPGFRPTTLGVNGVNATQKQV